MGDYSGGTIPLAVQPCSDLVVAQHETVQVLGDPTQLFEFHIRDNIMGDVEVCDGEAGGNIQLEIEALLRPHSLCQSVSVTQMTYNGGSITVLQLSCVYDTMLRLLVWVCLAVGVVFFLLLLVAFLVWWYNSRHQKTHPSSAHPQPNTSLEIRSSAGFSSDNPLKSEDEERTCGSRSDQGAGVRQSPAKESIYVLPSSKECNSVAGTGAFASGGPVGLGQATLISIGVFSIFSAVLAMNNCSSEAYARLVLSIPPEFHLHSVKLFFHSRYNNNVLTENWTTKNGTHLQIFDLPDAGPTEAMPCAGSLLCRNAYVQNLVGCDAATGQCVCERGFILRDGLCVDVDECLIGMCPSPGAVCENTIGSYVCHCHGDDFSSSRPALCQACTANCPENSFAWNHCFGTESEVCSDCRKCDPSEYEIERCTSYSDRRCLHAAHPVSTADEETTVQVVDGLTVATSANVFLEDLHNTRNLETTYYVTDMTQASDFYWDRLSGLRVNIGIHNVHLIPEYNDVKHEGDNNYMLKNPNDSADKTRFQRILQDHCSHPIPDHYNIMLEISRDRTTSAQNIVCNATDPGKPRCPPGLVDGDVYLHRSLNDPCAKSEDPVEALRPAANSIICMTNSSLLSKVFNQSYSKERALRFPNKKCQLARRRCSQCLSQSRCLASDVFERRCCQVDCYALADCRNSFNKECMNLPEECATGDVYRYTIQPVFQNIQRDFRCHVRHHRLTVLYELFMFIQIPVLGFQTPKAHRTVYAQDLEYQRQGDYTADYLTIEHSTGLDLEEDFILRGHYRGPGSVDYFIESATHEGDGENKKIEVHEIQTNVWMASAEFEQPFDYSTSSWVSSGDCEKDVEKFKPVSSSRSSRPVSVMVLKSPEQFQYFLKASENPPIFRFIVPANTSILPYHFQGPGPELLLNESLSAVLTSSETDPTWKLHIKGKMTGCPAYLGVTVNNRLEFEELCRYDLLVFCPTEFNITVNIPKRSNEPSVVTFDVRLQDIKKNYSIFLTHVLFTEQVSTTANRVVDFNTESKHSSLLVFGIVVSTFLTLLIFSVFYLYLEYLRRQYWMDRDVRKSQPFLMWQGAFSFRVFVTGGFVLIKVLYSVIFTFSILMWIFLLLTKSDILRLLKLEQFQAEQRNISTQLFVETEVASQAELLRLCELMDAHLSSCRHYVNVLLLNLSEAMASAHQMPWLMAGESSISSLMHTRTETQLNHYSSSFSDYAEHYRSKVASSFLPTVRKYRSYLDAVFPSDSWFSFPQSLFNSSQKAFEKKSVVREASDGTFGFLVDFGLFLEMEEIEEVSLWFHQFFKRFNASLPELPHFPQLLPNSSQCGAHSLTFLSNLIHDARPDLLDTFRYFTTHSYPGHFDDQASLKDFPYDNELSSSERDANYFHQDDTDVLLLFQETLSTPCLWMFCLILDVLLLSYRLSHIVLSAHRIQSALSYDNKGLYSLYKRVHQSNGGTPHADEPCLPFRDDATPPSRRLQDNAVPSAVDSRSCFTPCRFHDDIDFESDHDRGLLRTVVFGFFTSRALPKVLVALTLVAVFSTVIRTCWHMLAPEKLNSSGFFSAYVQPITVQVNLTNTFVVDQVQRYHDVTIDIYRSQMLLDIHNLHGLLTFFNSEQEYLTEKYLAEACSLLSHLSSNNSCDVSTAFPPLSIPILPCNFIPVQPQPRSGYQASTHRQQLLKAFEPFTTSMENILRTSEILVFVTAAAILLVNLSTWTLFHYLRVRRKSPPSCSSASPKPSSGRLEAFPHSNSRASENRSAPSSLIAYQPASTHECFEPELHFTKLSPVCLPSSNPSQLPVRTHGRLVDVGYSETNV